MEIYLLKSLDCHGKVKLLFILKYFNLHVKKIR